MTSEMRNYLKVEMKKRVDLFTDIESLKLLVGTWNLGGVRPYEKVDLSKWLLPFKENFLP
jgi:hypothetical protein